MEYEIDLIKKKATVALDYTTNQEVTSYLMDIIKLADACSGAIAAINIDLTSVCLNIQRVTTDMK